MTNDSYSLKNSFKLLKSIKSSFSELEKRALDNPLKTIPSYHTKYNLKKCHTQFSSLVLMPILEEPLETSKLDLIPWDLFNSNIKGKEEVKEEEEVYKVANGWKKITPKECEAVEWWYRIGRDKFRKKQRDAQLVESPNKSKLLF